MALSINSFNQEVQSASGGCTAYLEADPTRKKWDTFKTKDNDAIEWPFGRSIGLTTGQATEANGIVWFKVKYIIYRKKRTFPFSGYKYSLDRESNKFFPYESEDWFKGNEIELVDTTSSEEKREEIERILAEADQVANEEENQTGSGNNALQKFASLVTGSNNLIVYGGLAISAVVGFFVWKRYRK